MRRSASVLVMVLALLAVATPAGAQDGATTVSVDGVSFSFGPEIGKSVDITQVPERTDEQAQLVPPDGPHLTFTLYGPRPEGGRTPRVGLADASVRAYRIADLAGIEVSNRQVEALRALLEDRAALADFMAVTEDGYEPLPHLPVETAAAQALHARATFIDTAELTGIAYLLGYRQDVFPFRAGDFFYTFQAMSTDGEWYVSGDFALEADGFPEEVTQRDARSIARRWVAYLEQTVQQLDSAAPDAFSPPLTAIDALIGSIALEP
jgi:hypothetical protein